MKTALFWAVGLSMTVLSAAGAPRWNGSGGWDTNGRYGRIYNSETVETVQGEVTAVEEMAPLEGMSGGIHLLIKTATETIPVHLGPSWFLLNQDVQIRQGDKVELTGSRVTINEKPAIIAREVKKGPDVLTLRDEDGRPLWAAWRRSEPQK